MRATISSMPHTRYTGIWCDPIAAAPRDRRGVPAKCMYQVQYYVRTRYRIVPGPRIRPGTALALRTRVRVPGGYGSYVVGIKIGIGSALNLVCDEVIRSRASVAWLEHACAVSMAIPVFKSGGYFKGSWRIRRLGSLSIICCLLLVPNVSSFICILKHWRFDLLHKLSLPVVEGNFFSQTDSKLVQLELQYSVFVVIVLSTEIEWHLLKMYLRRRRSLQNLLPVHPRRKRHLKSQTLGRIRTVGVSSWRLEENLISLLSLLCVLRDFMSPTDNLFSPCSTLLAKPKTRKTNSSSMWV